MKNFKVLMTVIAILTGTTMAFSFKNPHVKRSAFNITKLGITTTLACSGTGNFTVPSSQAVDVTGESQGVGYTCDSESQLCTVQVASGGSITLSGNTYTVTAPYTLACGKFTKR